MSLELSSIKKAIAAFEKSINVILSKKKDDTSSKDEINTIRAGVIQSFEFTYELCWKFMKRWIEENVGTEIVDGVTRRELFRLSAENRLIDDVEKWMDFHKARNSTSHIYDEEIAGEILEVAFKFLPNAKDFLSRLESRQ